MGAMADTIVNDLLNLIVHGTPIANLADNAASSPLTNLYASLHTADPDTTGTQSTNEVTYTSYVRIAVARTTGGWTVVGRLIVPAADIVFVKPTGAVGQIARFAAIGFLSSGAGKIIFRGPIDPITITTSNAPRILRGSAFTFD